MKSFVGHILNKVVKSTPRSQKVSPTIKSVKPTKDISGSVKRVKSREYTKRIDATNKSKGKIDTGKKMMREGQQELRKMIDTGTAFKFKGGTTKEKTFPIKPGANPKKQHKGLVEESKPQKKFKKGKELDREKKMGGGMMGRRMNYAMGSSVRPAVKKIKELMDQSKAKKQDEARVKKMGGGMMGRRFGMKKGSGKFPDLTGDGKVTFADILKGRGVINGKKKKKA